MTESESPRPEEAGSLEQGRFQWERFVAVIGALAAAGNWVWTNVQSNRQEAARQKLEERVDANSRATKQIEMLPGILGLLREGRCDSDLAAVTLLKEASAFLDTSDSRFGLASARASLTMVKSRQEASQHLSPPGTYCACDSLTLVTSLTETGRDADLARIAAQISDLARDATGPCARAQHHTLKADLETAARSLTEQQYAIVFANDEDCEAARTSYRRTADALMKARGDKFDRTLLRLQAGTGRWQMYLVTTYGRFTLDQAGNLISQLQGKEGVQSDIYWARMKTYTDQSACVP